ncbi:MAG TPA: hypothetical protein VHQ87_05925 [Rhizobacter sp.]|nr:hypothetical protein [Rhizobacter sp.]
MLLALACAPAGAAEAARQLAFGSYAARPRPVISTYDAAGQPLAVHESEVTTWIDGGMALFQQAKGRCVMVRASAPGASSRLTCVYTDESGDQFVSEALLDSAVVEGFGVKRSHFVRGTGKYSGIVGELVAYPVSVRAPTAKADGRVVGRIEIRYQLAISMPSADV